MAASHHIIPGLLTHYVALDLRDCYTCSFPEFLPFCSQLYYFSSFKDFQSIQA